MEIQRLRLGSLFRRGIRIVAEPCAQHQHKIQPQRRRNWRIFTDAEFAQKAADVVGSYLNPPEIAVALCVDEKPRIQVLERAQGWIRLSDGRALNGFNHRYKRHGNHLLRRFGGSQR